MDGGAQQKRKATALKKEIKRNAAHKREQAQSHNATAPDVTNRRFNIISDMTIAAGSLSTQSTTPSTPGNRTSTNSNAIALSEKPRLIDTLPWSYLQHQRSDTLEQASAREWNFIMKYIDFVFPAMFPFYQPHIFDTGRSWLLLLLRKSRIAYHAALGLSCYYFTMALNDAEEANEHTTCKQLRWEEVDGETEKCFDSLRAEISVLNLKQGVMSITTMEKVELMNSITQVIVFEISMGKSKPWNTHLPAAINLFEEIMANPAARPVYRDQPQSKFASVLLGIGDPVWTNPWPSNHIWSPEQTGFRFCAGLLIFIDIMAGTMLGQSPQLAHYHSDVLAEIDDGQAAVGEAEIRLSTIVGCPNYIATSIAEVSTIVMWKRTHEYGAQDAHLSDRISKIATSQQNNIRKLHESLTASAKSRSDYHYSLGPALLDLGPASPISCVVALIWNLAAEIFRLTVTCGWALDNHTIQANVAHIRELLETIPPSQLRTLAWPICVAGCLASDYQESSFTALFLRLDRVQTVGPLNDARQLMEKAWQNRLFLHESKHDLASALATLSPPVLII
jgi:hypothetical protein